MIRRRPTTAPSSSCSHLQSASSPFSVTSGANVRSSRTRPLVLACQDHHHHHQSLLTSRLQKPSTSLLPLWQSSSARYIGNSSSSKSSVSNSCSGSSAPITAKNPRSLTSNHQRRSTHLVKLHLAPNNTAPVAVTNSRLRQGALYARRHQHPAIQADTSYPRAKPSLPKLHQSHHLQSQNSSSSSSGGGGGGGAGKGSFTPNQQSHIRASSVLAREINVLATTSGGKTSSVSRCLAKTKSCFQQSKEQKKPILNTKTTRLGALTGGGGGIKTASKISLNLSTSSLTLAVVKRARQANVALTRTTTTSHQQSKQTLASVRRHHRQHQQALATLESPSVASSGYQSRASTSASRSNSSDGGSSSSASDVQTDGRTLPTSGNSSAQPIAIALNCTVSDDNSAAAVERTATAIAKAVNGHDQNQNNTNGTSTDIEPVVASEFEPISTNHHHLESIAIAKAEPQPKQVLPVASSAVVAQRNNEEEEDDDDNDLHYYHHKTMIISSSPSEIDYGDSEEEGQVVKPQAVQNQQALKQQPPPEITIRTDLIGDHYDLELRPFARGKFAQVKRCVHKKSKQCFAAKCIKKRRRLADIRNEILLEISALKLSYYTNRIVKLYEVYETPSEIIFVLEMAKGGELQRVIDDEEVIDEHLVRQMVKQILEGLIQLHDNDIAHLDIKPQNLLLTEPFPNGDILLCDFGISRRITKDCEIREICGTPDYVAPEILSYDPISLATDMWSLGVLTYVLLSGYSPFGSENKQQTFCNITQAVLDFPSEIFDKISEEAIDFMQKLILREPTERLTSRQARQHPWLSGGTSSC